MPKNSYSLSYDLNSLIIYKGRDYDVFFIDCDEWMQHVHILLIRSLIEKSTGSLKNNLATTRAMMAIVYK